MRPLRFMAFFGAVVLLAPGCFATRVVRTDTTTSYDLVRAEPMPTPSPDGTLVVEALAVPPPPAAAPTATPVRLPSSVAAAAVPTWDPLPSYVAQFTGSGWVRRPIFGGSAQQSTTFGRWRPFPGRSAVTVPYGYGATTGAYGSASPHFSSPPSYSGSLSSHFAGGYPGSGY